MLGLKVNHVSKRGAWLSDMTAVNMYISEFYFISYTFDRFDNMSTMLA